MILLMLGMFFAVAVVEIALFIRGERKPVYDRNFEYEFLDIYAKAFKRESSFYQPVPQRRLKAIHFPVCKPSRTKRIFIIGSSTAAKFDESTLARDFQLVLPQYDFEVINCGMGMFDAYRTQLMGKEVLEYDPDCIVVIVGNSEFLRLRRVNPWKYKGVLAYSGILRRLGDLIAPPIIVRTLEESDRYYVRSLSLLLQEASRRHVPIVLCTIPVNYHDSHFNGGEINYDKDYILLLDALRQHNGKASLHHLDALKKRYPVTAFLDYYQSLVSELTGNYHAEYVAYAHALDTDSSPIACTPRRNRMIRSLAIQYSLPLADIEQRILSLAPHNCPGFDLFADNCHYLPPVSRVYAESIIDAIASFNQVHKGIVLASGDQWRMDALKKTSYAEICADIAKAGYRLDVDRILQFALCSTLNFPNPDPHFPGQMKRTVFDSIGLQCFQMLNEINPSLLRILPDRRNELKVLLDSIWMGNLASKIDTNWKNILLHVGEASRRAGRYTDALCYFNKVIALDPCDVRAHYFRGWTYLALQKGKEAAKDFDDAIRFCPFLGSKLSGDIDVNSQKN